MRENIEKLYEEFKQFGESSKVIKYKLVAGRNGKIVLSVHNFEDKTNDKRYFDNEDAFEEYLQGIVELNRKVEKWCE